MTELILDFPYAICLLLCVARPQAVRDWGSVSPATPVDTVLPSWQGVRRYPQMGTMLPSLPHNTAGAVGVTVVDITSHSAFIYWW